MVLSNNITNQLFGGLLYINNMETIQLEDFLWDQQERMLNSMPPDYNGNQIDWELNVIFWIIRARQSIIDDTININTVKFIADNMVAVAQG